MKKIFEVIYAFLVGLIGDDVSEEVTKALADLKAMIDSLTDETKTAEEVANECESITLMSLPLPDGSVQRTFALNIKKLNDIQEVTKNLPQVLNEYIESKDIVQIVNEMTKLKNNL